MDCKTYRLKVIEQIAKGNYPVVEILPHMDECDQESVLNAHMRAKLVDIMVDLGDADYPMYKFVLDLSDFTEYNRPHERADWYVDSRGSDLDTARNTGNWPKDDRDEIWLAEGDDPERYFRTLDFNVNSLHAEYMESNYDGSYTDWLEDIVLSARKCLDETITEGLEKEREAMIIRELKKV